MLITNSTLELRQYEGVRNGFEPKVIKSRVLLEAI